MKNKYSGWTLIELAFALAVIFFLAYMTPDLIRRFTGSPAKPGLSTFEIPSTPRAQPWTAYKTLPAVIEKHKDKLTQWTARTTGPNTAGPQVLTSQQRLEVLRDISATLSLSQWPQPPAAAPGAMFYEWGLMTDRAGNAILAGGLVFATMRYPLSLLKNDGSMVQINRCIQPSAAQAGTDLGSGFAAQHLWVWNRNEDQKIVIVGRSVSMAQVVAGFRHPEETPTLAVLIDGVAAATAQLTNVRTQPPDGTGLATHMLQGEIEDKTLGKLSLRGRWIKDTFAANQYQHSLNAGVLTPIEPHLDY